MAQQAPPYDLPLIGDRYVFFKSILNNDNPSLRAFGQHAQSNLNSIGSLTISSGTDYKSKQETSFYNMQSYIKFIEQMASAERGAEEAFIQQQISLLKQNKEDELVQELEKFLQISQNDPNAFLLTINKLFQETQVFEENVENSLQRISSISKNMEQFDETIIKQIQTSFEENYTTYKTNLVNAISKLPEAKADLTYNIIKNINANLASTINKIIKDLSSNGDFLESLYTSFNQNNNADISETQFKSIVINTIVQEVLSGRNITFDKDLSNSIKSILKNMSDDIERQQEMSSKEYINVFKDTQQSISSIEELAFEKNASLSNAILLLDDASIKKLKKKYPKTSDLIDNLLKLNTEENQNTQTLKNAKSILTTKLRQIVEDRAKKKIGRSFKNMKPEDILKEIKNIDKFITPINLSNSLNNQLSGMSISHDAVAEAIVSQESMQKIRNVIVSNIPGKQIQLKADVRFSTGYVSENTEFIDNNLMQNIIDSTIKDHYKDFMEDYKSLGGGATDVSAAIQAYKGQLLKMKQNIDKLVKSHNLPDESKKKLYEALYNTFSVSVSVKDYDLYNNDLGVHGGALGPGKLPEGVVNNITKMYETGGITAIDANKIIFAVLNCGDAMIGSEIRSHLETYLLGGAALLMFDEGFANSEQFLQQVTAEFEGFQGQRAVHIYRVSNMYAPASFILDKIAKNLWQVYFDALTETEPKNIEQQNKVTIINNVTESAIPSSESMPVPSDRWNSVSATTMSSVKITFSFMGGLLDILENFKAAMNTQ